MRVQVVRADGTSEYVPLDPKAELRVGSGPAANLRFPDANVRVLHCGIVFAEGAFHLVSAKKLGGVELNGRLVMSAPLAAGDRIRVGSAELIVLADDGAGAGSPAAPPSSANDVDALIAGVGETPPSPRRGARPSIDLFEAARLEREAMAQRSAAQQPAVAEDELVAELEEIIDDQDTVELQAIARRPVDEQNEELSLGSELVPIVPMETSGLGLPSPAWPAVGVALGTGELTSASRAAPVAAPGAWWKSGLVFWPALGILVAIVSALGTLLVEQLPSAEDRLQAARRLEQAGDHDGATREYGEFLRRHPTHARAGEATMERGLIRLRAGMARANTTSERVAVAAEVVDLLGEFVARPPCQAALASVLPDLASEAILRAKAASGDATPANLATARQSVVLLARALSPSSLQDPSAIDNLRLQLAVVERESSWGDDADRANREIEPLLRDGNLWKAHATLQEMLAAHPEGRDDVSLARPWRAAAESVAKLVAFDPSPRAPAVGESPARSPRPLATSFSIARPAPAGVGQVVPVHSPSQGTVHGLDIGSGAVLWKRDLGPLGVVVPTGAGARGGAVAFDSRTEELLHLDSATGKLIWRQTLGGLAAPPQLIGEHLFAPLADASLAEVELASGSLRRYRFPQTLSAPPLADGATLVLVGDHAYVYLLSPARHAVTDAWYLGHARESVRAAPVILGANWLFQELGVDSTRWHLVARERPYKKIQTLEIPEPCSLAPVVMGDRVVLVADSGSIYMLEPQAPDASRPWRVVTQGRVADGVWSLPRFSVLLRQRLWVGGDGLRIFDMEARSRSLSGGAVRFAGQTISQPPQAARDLVILSRELPGGGAIATALSAQGHQVRWETYLGMPAATRPRADSNEILYLNRCGALVRVPLADRPAAAAVIGPLDVPASTQFVVSLAAESPGPHGRSAKLTPEVRGSAVPLANGRWALAAPEVAEIVLLESASRSAKPTRVALPGPLADRVAAVDRWLVAAIGSGPVVLIDPATGQLAGTPFWPEFTPGSTFGWDGPFVVGNGAVCVLHDGRELIAMRVATGESQPSLAGLARRTLASPVSARPIDFADRIWLGQAEKLSIVSPDSLREELAIDVGGAPRRLFAATPDHLVVECENGIVACVTREKKVAWQKTLDFGQLVGVSGRVGERLMLAFSSGQVVTVDSARGETLAEVTTEIPLGGDVVEVGERLIVVHRNGELYEWLP